MNCRHAQRLLSDHHDEDLAGREAGAVATHLRGCRACRRFQKTLVTISGQVREMGEWQAELHPALRRRVLARWSAQRMNSRLQRAEVRLPGLRPARSPEGDFVPPLPVVSTARLPTAAVSLGAAAAAAVLVACLGLAGWRHGRMNPSDTAVVRQRLPERGRAMQLSANTSLHPWERRRGGGSAGEAGRSGFGAAAAGAGSRDPLHAPRSGRGRPRAQDKERNLYRARGHSLLAAAVDDLSYLNRDPAPGFQQWAPLSPDAWREIQRRVRHLPMRRDDFIQIPFPRLATLSNRQIAEAVEAYKREAAIVDPRLAHEVTCAFKATALSDLCDRLRAETGIQLSAGPSVADEKVTVFCEKLSLREVMRQLSRPFGYTWLRTRQAFRRSGVQAFGKETSDLNARTPERLNAEYRYELVQDLRSQLLEEELRNRDRDAALIALDREMSQYRPYLSLSPDEALARAQTAGPEEKKWLEQLASCNWGPIQMYFRLSPPELAALRSGQTGFVPSAGRPIPGLMFSQEPKSGEQMLPADLARGVLECLRDVRLVRREGGYDFASPKLNAESLSLTAIPEARAGVALSLDQSEVGQFTLQGSSRFTTGSSSDDPGGGRSKGPFAVGMSQAAPGPDSALTSAAWAHDATLRPRVSVQPDGRRQTVDGSPTKTTAVGTSAPSTVYRLPPAVSDKVTSADVLEALHRASGMPIVADYYTRLYPVETVSVRDRPLFETLNQLADAMRLRWNKEGGWLQLRSTSFYNDRLKEVPNRLLARWSAARRQRGILTLDDLVEIAQLPDAQLDASEMAEGARDCWGLVEWELARGRTQRPHLRFLAQLTPAQRQEALAPTGLAFTRMSLAQQQQFISLMLGSQTDALQSLEELAGAALRVAYTQPGGFEWPGLGPANVHLFRPSPVRARTREAVLEAARRIDPQVDPAQIVPTELALTILYTSNPRPGAFVHVERATLSGCGGYDGRPDARPHGTKP